MVRVMNVYLLKLLSLDLPRSEHGRIIPRVTSHNHWRNSTFLASSSKDSEKYTSIKHTNSKMFLKFL